MRELERCIEIAQARQEHARRHREEAPPQKVRGLDPFNHESRWERPPAGQHRDQVRDHRAVQNAHDRMRHPFARVHVSQLFPNRNLDHEVREREDDFRNEDANEHKHPRALP